MIMTIPSPPPPPLTQSNRISELELMRFIAASAIMCLHFGFLFNKGWIFVEFFFILTGLLMAHSAQRLLTEKEKFTIGTETKNFIIKKIRPLLPYLIIGYFMMIIVYFIRPNTEFAVDDFLNQIPGYLLLMDVGFDVESPMMLGTVWYISAMIIGLLIIYPIYLRCGKDNAWIVMLLTFIFLIALIINNYTRLEVWRQWQGFTSWGLLRGIGEMALGAFCYDICVRLKSVKTTICGRLSITLIKFALVAIVLMWSCSFFTGTKDFVIMFLIAMFIITMYAEKGFYVPRGNRICQYLGTLSIPVYLFHRPIQRAITYLLGAEFFKNNIILSIALVFVVSIIIVELIKYGKKKDLYGKVKNVFISKESGNEQ